MILFIAEKPDLAKVIAAALGNPVSKSGYIESGNNIITWAYGHLLELVPPDVKGKKKPSGIPRKPKYQYTANGKIKT